MEFHFSIGVILACFVTVDCGRFLSNKYDRETVEWMAMENDRDQLTSEELIQPELLFDAGKDVFFNLYTRSNPRNPQSLILDDVNNLTTSHFDPDVATKFIVHGWNNNGESPACVDIRNAFLSVANYNIIVVDWSLGSGSNYITSRSNIFQVGPHVGEFIKFLVSAGHARLDKISCIGHSLGAHICGLAGKAVDGKMAAIYGLDPALPLFLLTSTKDRLDRGDAEYVEAVHTCGGALGFFAPIGDADFYPNGGVTQPGCDIIGLCAHGRSHEFFAESITTDVPFKAIRCAGFENITSSPCEPVGKGANMGGVIDKRGTEGCFYLKTRSSHPFALG